MTKLNRTNLISWATRNANNVEIMTTQELVMSNGDIYKTEMIGFEKKGKGLVYHWFKVYTDVKNGDVSESVHFDHSYSQRTGSSKKGWKHEWKLRQSMGF
jgi:hypothetical protein